MNRRSLFFMKAKRELSVSGLKEDNSGKKDTFIKNGKNVQKQWKNIQKKTDKVLRETRF